MTVDELHDVIEREFMGVNSRLDKINGRVSRAEESIVNLRIRDAYWAGGAAVTILLIKLLWG